jgi:hypothetical protein
VTITFADDAVKNTWLRVTLRADDHTGLAADDVFYFGNQLGETGNAAADAAVNALDVSALRAHLSTAPATLASSFDLNRDGRVNALDLVLVRKGLTLVPLPLISLLG